MTIPSFAVTDVVVAVMVRSFDAMGLRLVYINHWDNVANNEGNKQQG